jgi:3-hydroxybutyryl-CoA dehydrogenase
MQLQDIKKIACLGTGTMGNGIAFLAAKAGYEVNMFGRSAASIEKGMKGVENAVRMYVENELMPAQDADAVRSRIKGVTSLREAGQGAQMVVESVAEELSVKQDVFAVMEEACLPDAIMATNTSGLSPTQIAANLKKPQNFVVPHFFSPPYLLPVVEIVPAAATTLEVRKLAAAWAKHIGNQPLELEKEALGFVLNRIQSACIREALYIVEQGWATPENIDIGIKYSLGRRYGVTGPLMSADMGGLDIFLAIAGYAYKDMCNSAEPLPIMKKLVAEGNLGAKTGKGLYEWTPEKLKEISKKREQVLVQWLKEDLKESK